RLRDSLASRHKLHEKDDLLHRLILFWIITVTFLYQYMTPDLSINLGIRFTPDRLIFSFILLVFLWKCLLGELKMAKISTLELAMFIFAIWSTISWFTSGVDMRTSDVYEAKLRWLTTLFNFCHIPFLFYFITKSIGYNKEQM